MTKVVILWLSTVLLGVAQSDKRQPDEWQRLEESLAQASMKSDRPKKGFVPDERTAVRIGEAVVAALYGENQTAKERPFRGHLEGNIWTVVGTLTPQGAYGGAAVIRISKTDGRVLFAVHQH